MSTFLRVLFSTPEEPLSPLARYTQANGIFYLLLGASFYVMPGMTAMFGASAHVGQEDGLLRVIGVCIAIIGWFYVIGGRTNRASFGLATVVDRLLLPFLVLPLAAAGLVEWSLVLPLAILDPVLGLGALLIWSRQA